MTDDINTDTAAWRNLITQWHLDQGLPDCGCDDDTADGDFCAPSVVWAEERYAIRSDPGLDGDPDDWNHDVWMAAWGRNAPLIASDLEYRMPKPPAGMSWLVTRMLLKGKTAVEMTLVKLGSSRLTTVSSARAFAEPTTVAARARALLEALS